MIVTFDPGVKVAGLAFWEGAELASAVLVRGDGWLATANIAFATVKNTCPIEAVTDVVIEQPQVYIQRRLKGDPNDLIAVAMVAGAFAVRFYGSARITMYRPNEWKGNVPKNISIKRYQERLSAEEINRVDDKPRSLAHNVWDAVGLGQYHVGRR